MFGTYSEAIAILTTMLEKTNGIQARCCSDEMKQRLQDRAVALAEAIDALDEAREAEQNQFERHYQDEIDRIADVEEHKLAGMENNKGEYDA